MSRVSTSAVSGNCVIMSCMDRSDTKQPELTPEQQRALDAHGGIVEGDSFVLMDKDVILDFFGYGSPHDLLRELQPAFDQADRGELQEWDVGAFLARMRRSDSGKPD